MEHQYHLSKAWTPNFDTGEVKPSELVKRAKNGRVYMTELAGHLLAPFIGTSSEMIPHAAGMFMPPPVYQHAIRGLKHHEKMGISPYMIERHPDHQDAAYRINMNDWEDHGEHPATQPQEMHAFSSPSILNRFEDIHHSLDNYAPAMRILHTALGDAMKNSPHGGPVLVYPEQYVMRQNGTIKNTIRHEEGHRGLDTLPGDNLWDHFDLDNMADHPSFPHLEMAANELHQRGYPWNINVLMEEALVHILAGQHRDMGLNQKQAKGVLRMLLDHGAKYHGDAFYDAIRAGTIGARKPDVALHQEQRNRTFEKSVVIVRRSEQDEESERVEKGADARIALRSGERESEGVRGGAPERAGGVRAGIRQDVSPGDGRGDNGGRAGQSRLIVIRKAAAQTGETYRTNTSGRSGVATVSHIRPIDEALFEQHIRPNLPAGYAGTLDDYLAHNPYHTHVRMDHQMITSTDGNMQTTRYTDPKLTHVGPLESLRPTNAKQVADFRDKEPAVPFQELSAIGGEKQPLSIQVRSALMRHFNLPKKQAVALTGLLGRWANAWATEHGKKPEDWWNTRLSYIGSGYSDYQRGMREAAHSYLYGPHEPGELNGEAFPPRDAWTPEDYEMVGNAFGTENLGPLTPTQKITDRNGREWVIPGGLDGNFTHLDQMWLKAQGYDPSAMHEDLRVPLYQKLARTNAPTDNDPVGHFYRLLFGLTSPNMPLTDQEFMMSRLRPQTMEDIAKMAQYTNLAPNDPGQEDVNWVSDMMRKDYNLQSKGKGGLGVGGSVPLFYAAEMARMFLSNPGFFVRKPEEDWDHFTERLASQVKGLRSKTASFGSVWHDPANSQSLAADRHIGRDWIMHAPDAEDMRQQFLNTWNSSAKKRKAAQTAALKENDQNLKGKFITPEEHQQVMGEIMAQTLDPHKTFQEMFSTPIGRAFTTEAMFKLLADQSIKYREAKRLHEPPVVQEGEDYAGMLARSGVSPKLLGQRPDGSYEYAHLLPHDPVHNPQGVEWAEEPESVSVMSPLYKRVVKHYRDRGKELGLAGFPVQWMDWDSRRHRLEPHEIMFPGLHRMPKASLSQATRSIALHSGMGYADTTLSGGSQELRPARPLDDQRDFRDLLYFQGSPHNPIALSQMTHDGRWLVQAMRSPDISSAIHEFSHIFLHDLNGSEMQAVESWLGVKGGTWKTEQNGQDVYHHGKWSDGDIEKFSRAVEKYFYNGAAPNKRMTRLFGYFRNWMKAVYDQPVPKKEQGEPLKRKDATRELKNQPIDFGVPEEITNILHGRFGGGVQKCVLIVRKAYEGTPKRRFGPEGVKVEYLDPNALFIRYIHPETGRQIGKMRVQLNPKDQSASIYGIIVKHRHSGRGIGHRLYEAMRNELMERGVKRVSGQIAGSGPVHIREAVFGPGATRYYVGEHEFTPEEAAYRSDKEKLPLNAETTLNKAYVSEGLVKKPQAALKPHERQKPIEPVKWRGSASQGAYNLADVNKRSADGNVERRIVIRPAAKVDVALSGGGKQSKQNAADYRARTGDDFSGQKGAWKPVSASKERSAAVWNPLQTPTADQPVIPHTPWVMEAGKAGLDRYWNYTNQTAPPKRSRSNAPQMEATEFRFVDEGVAKQAAAQMAGTYKWDDKENAWRVWVPKGRK